jgi:CheY-like chemotaxis protein
MRKNVLIIDDDEDSLALIEDVLSYSNFNTKGILQTSNIFDSINNFKADLILMDYILSGINGGELCHQVKTNSKTAHIPVVLISAYPRILESLGKYGCDAFIAKPFDINYLISRLNDCFHDISI